MIISNYLECVKTGRNDSKFTIDNYHINTVEIIKVFKVNIFMLITNFSRLIILLFCKMMPFQIFDQFNALFKETNWKNLGFCVEKERERKDMNVPKSVHQGTKRYDQKERAAVNF